MKTRWRALARIVALGGCAIVSGADWVEQRTAHDRPGTYNGGLVVRVMGHDGAPVHARVSVWDHGNTVATETDAKGRAELHGIFTRHGLSIGVGGTDDLRPHYQRIRGVSNGVVDLGVARLERNFSVTGVLLQKDIDGVLRTRSDRATVKLNGPWRWRGGGYGNDRAHDRDRREGVFRIDDFDIEPDLFLEIRWWSDEQRDSIVHKVPFSVDLVAGDVRELRLPPLDSSLEGTMTYEPDLDDRLVDYHWVDGPRMTLLSMNGTTAGWNVIYNLPRPDEEHGRKANTFALTDLPAGNYRLFHHLAIDLSSKQPQFGQFGP